MKGEDMAKKQHGLTSEDMVEFAKLSVRSALESAMYDVSDEDLDAAFKDFWAAATVIGAFELLSASDILGEIYDIAKQKTLKAVTGAAHGIRRYEAEGKEFTKAEQEIFDLLSSRGIFDMISNHENCDCDMCMLERRLVESPGVLTVDQLEELMEEFDELCGVELDDKDTVH